MAREDPAGLARYHERRLVWTANIGPIKTPQLEQLDEDLLEIVDSNLQDTGRTKPAALVDAFRAWARRPRCLSSYAGSTASRSRCAGRRPPQGTGDADTLAERAKDAVLTWTHA